MFSFLTKLIINTVALLAVIRLIPGISVDRWETAIAAAVVLAFLNAFLRPLLILFTLPLNVLSLGIMTLFINGFMFYLVPKVVPGMFIRDFGSAFWGALAFSVISFLLSLLITPKKPNIRFYSRRGGPRSKPPDQDVIDVEGKVES